MRLALVWCGWLAIGSRPSVPRTLSAVAFATIGERRRRGGGSCWFLNAFGVTALVARFTLTEVPGYCSNRMASTGNTDFCDPDSPVARSQIQHSGSATSLDLCNTIQPRSLYRLRDDIILNEIELQRARSLSSTIARYLATHPNLVVRSS